VAETAAVGAVSSVPLAGGVLGAAVQYALGIGFQQRMDDWLEQVAQAITRLEERTGKSLDELAQEPLFLDAVAHATRAAQATHQQEKIDALRNGLMHSLGDDAPNVDEQRRFFRIIDQFSPAHLRMLGLLGDPRGALERAGVQPPDLYMGGRSHLLELLPEFTNRREWYDLLANDISQAGLAQTNLHTTMTGAGIYEPCTTPLGDRFLQFIAAA
jgi:hypothetical protein